VTLAPAAELAEDWRPWAAALGISDTATITVLADGAKWIWRQAKAQFPAARGVLDLFHVWQHLAEPPARCTAIAPAPPRRGPTPAAAPC